MMPIDRLIRVFDAERTPYLEWHDGPSLGEVDDAMESLNPEERVKASRMVAERIRKGYDPYLGRAAELLATDECLAALHEALGRAADALSASTIARNLLFMGGNEEAMAVLRAIVGNRSLPWHGRVDALVNLKIAMDAAGRKRPVTGFITPELESTLFAAIEDDDYLVRCHAAEALLKVGGDKTDLAQQKELFGHICGRHPTDTAPNDADREGFRKAADILRAKLKQMKQEPSESPAKSEIGT